MKETNVKRSKEERLVNERIAREVKDFVSGSKEVYKNRFKNQGKKISIIDIDEELVEDIAEIFS